MAYEIGGNTLKGLMIFDPANGQNLALTVLFDVGGNAAAQCYTVSTGAAYEI
jgi:hypothetical protein